MKTNIYSILDNNIKDKDGDEDKDEDKDEEKLKSLRIINYLEKQVNFNLGKEPIIILPLKKKKGRKSKKDKQLELEALEKNKVAPKLFPNLNEKIFDVIEIKGKEYFFDENFGIIYDEEANQVGIKRDNKYIIYDEVEINKIVDQIKLDNEEISQILKSHDK